MVDAAVLPMWTVYDHPADFPDCFIARKWLIEGGETKATDEVITSSDLTELREQIVIQTGCASKLMRSPGDDPKIVEVWL